VSNIIKNLVKRYSFFIIILCITLIISLINKDIGVKTFNTAGFSLKQMLSVLPPIMLLLGLMDVWVPREKMMKYMGENSGILGVALAITIGSLAAGPMYAAFPFAAVLLKKGVKFSNVIVFMNAWCVTKIPTVMFELTSLGYKFTLIRLAVNLPGIIIMGYIVQGLLSKNELENIYLNSEKQ
jgi:uncharacterized membrane protein YraQ (UPF0718 family)